MTTDGHYIATRAEEHEVSDDTTRAENLSERATIPSEKLDELETEEGDEEADEEAEDEDGPCKVVPINKPLYIETWDEADWQRTGKQFMTLAASDIAVQAVDPNG